jgi:hypothetical protein
MTSRENLIALSRGSQELTSRPILNWPVAGEGDFVIANSATELVAILDPDKINLIQVLNPFGLSIERGVNLNDLHDQSIEKGSDALSELSETIIQQIQAGIDAGADGVFYVLRGARGAFCTPMQYGGLYLELDREILNHFESTLMNVIYVDGNDDLYIDFVSDLPAHVFAWDSELSTFDSDYVRTFRNGSQASADSQSEVQLIPGVVSIADFLQKEPSYAV